MAKAKSKARPAPRSLPSEAFRHGERAFGARYLRDGFSFGRELDFAFALGRGGGLIAPLVLFEDGDPAALSRLAFPDARVYRNVALACVRDSEPRWQTRLAEEPKPPALTEDEARDIFSRRSLSAEGCRSVEAMVGPSCTLACLVDWLERRDVLPAGVSAWDNNELLDYFKVLHGLLLRVPEDEHRRARDRLEALYAARQRRHGSLELDVLLHGKEGIVRSGYKYIKETDSYGRQPGSDAPVSAYQLLYLDGEADYIVSSQRRLWELQSWKPRKWMLSPEAPRLYFLGGRALLELELRVVDSYPKTMHEGAFDAYREIRSAEAVRLMLRLGRDGSKVAKKVAVWFSERIAFAKPVLDGIAGDASDPDKDLARVRLSAVS